MAMDLKEIEKLIKESLPDAIVEIQDLAGDGNHYSATVSSSKFKLFTLKVFLIEFPNTLLISLFLSNFVTEVLFKVKVDCADVKRLKSLALDVDSNNPNVWS